MVMGFIDLIDFQIYHFTPFGRRSLKILQENVDLTNSIEFWGRICLWLSFTAAYDPD